MIAVYTKSNLQSAGFQRAARTHKSHFFRDLKYGEGDFGLSASDIQKIAQKLQPEHSAIIILFENVWERKLNDIAKKHNGAVVSQRLIAPAALAKVAHELGQSSKSPSV